jgi:hypothetical protein
MPTGAGCATGNPVYWVGLKLRRTVTKNKGLETIQSHMSPALCQSQDFTLSHRYASGMKWRIPAGAKDQAFPVKSKTPTALVDNG